MKTEGRPLTQLEIDAMKKTPEYNLGYYTAIWDMLELLAAEGVAFAKGAKLFVKAYNTQHPRHDFHTKDKIGQGNIKDGESNTSSESKDAIQVPTEQGIPEGDSTAQSAERVADNA
jgi:hypothetical protein